MKIRRTSDLDYTKYMKTLIAGHPGAGKTLMAATSDHPLFASTDPRFMSIADKGIPVVDITAESDLLELKTMLNRPEDERDKLFTFPVRTLIIDTVNNLQRIMQRERLRDVGRDTFQTEDWVWLGEHMPTLIEALIKLPLNVVFITHLQNKSNDDAGSGWFQPALSGQTASFIASQCDISGVIVASSPFGIDNDRDENLPEAKVRRMFVTASSERYPYLKDQSGKLPAEFEINFKDDFSRIRGLVYANADEIPRHDPIDVELPKGETIAPAKPLLIKAKDRPVSAEEAKAAVQQAKSSGSTVSVDSSGRRVLGAKPKGEKIDTAETVSSEENNPTPVENNEPTLPPKPAKVTPPKKAESYEYGGISSHNELPAGVTPIQELGGQVGYYCEQTGRELPRAAKAEMSKIKFSGRVLHPDVWDEAKQKA